MSVTGHSNCRHPSDFYETPAWCTRAILRRFGGPIPGVRTVLDPACGRGAILNVVRELWPYVVTIGFELDGERAEIARSRGQVGKQRKALSLGSKVRRARILRGWSQDTLGLEVGVAQSTIKDIEAGYNWPSVHVLVRLCAALRVSADWLLAGLAQSEKETA